MLKIKTVVKIILGISIVSSLLYSSDEYSFRKYNNVKEFYKNTTLDAIEIARKYKLPPAAILAIAGLESGYGSGYVAQITGNILSLGAFKSDKELPRLYLPYSKSDKKVLFDPAVIKKYSKYDLSWKKRPKSLKRDYRPSPYAGTDKRLELLKYDKKLRDIAIKDCFKDFATRWIVKSSNIKVFAQTRVWLDKLIDKNGIDIIFDKDTNIQFISKIGGHPRSFNYRKTWPQKVKYIMKKVGLVKLSKDMYFKNKNFNTAWSSK